MASLTWRDPTELTRSIRPGGFIQIRAEWVAEVEAALAGQKSMQAAVVETVDPFEGCVFDGLEAAPWSAAMDDLCLEQAVDGLDGGIEAPMFVKWALGAFSACTAR